MPESMGALFFLTMLDRGPTRYKSAIPRGFLYEVRNSPFDRETRRTGSDDRLSSINGDRKKSSRIFSRFTRSIHANIE